MYSGKIFSRYCGGLNSATTAEGELFFHCRTLTGNEKEKCYSLSAL